ncbi:ParD-like family protein, partial [Klebsiella pneumoniae]
LGMMSELYPELNHQQIKLLMLKSGSDRLLEVINAINNH